MFEDSTFESTGRIRTRSRGWMLAALTLNSTILFALVLIPLIYPEALPQQALSVLLEAPAPPTQSQPAPKPVTTQPRSTLEILDGHIFAPSKIPQGIVQLTKLEPVPGDAIPGLVQGLTGPGVPGSLFPGHAEPPVVRPETKGPVHLSSGVVAGLLLQKTPPLYPSIAVAMHTEGTVVLQAAISKTGTIENLRVVSGPVMLQQAALSAVSHWRYRP